MSLRDRIDAESKQALDILWEALPGGLNGIPDIIARRATISAMPFKPPGRALQRSSSAGLLSASIRSHKDMICRSAFSSAECNAYH